MPDQGRPVARLGAFVLDKAIGQGGMGEVWRGRHATSGFPVAIKRVKPHVDVSGFGNEVRAIARLSHPSICALLDHGVQDGAPWLAMELVAGGSLDGVPRPLAWNELRAVLLGVLDALAHAHAHRVLHRDIKAGNVLLVDKGDPGAGLKLTDFGIALGMEDETGGDAEDNVAGTLHYMPPEQMLGEWRDFGPWTDLYALGNMAYKLSAGKAPFFGRKGQELARAQLEDEVPPLVPRVPVSPAFEAWVRLLVQKDPWKRFRTAADAASALRDLPPPDAVAGRTGARPGVAIASLSTSAVAPARSWRHALPPPLSPALVHAGLSMFGLRTVPFVGREDARDRLWADLLAVARTRSPRVVVVRGPSGMGKSRLGEWFAERATEVGAAEVHRVPAGPLQAQTEGLSRLVRRAVGALSCPVDVARERVEVWEEVTRGDRDPLDVEAILDVFLPGEARVQLDSAAERHLVARQVLERCVAERPSIVLIDDAAYATDALAFVTSCLGQPLPVLFVAVASDEAAAEQADGGAALDALAGSVTPGSAGRGSREERLEPLSRSERSDLLGALLALESGLAAQIEERSAGSPLLAVQIVGDLVARGALELAETRFVLARGHEVDLPADVHALWQRAIERAVGTSKDAPQLRDALWRAAALGMEVPLGAWSQVCEDPHNPLTLRRDGLMQRTALVDRLVSLRLAVDTDDGFRFANGTLREALLGEAEAAGVLAQIHADCATVIARAPGPGQAERLGLHRLAAGQVSEALAPLWQGVRERERWEGPRAALVLLDAYRGALERADVRWDDARWCEAFVRRGDLLRTAGDFEAALPWFHQGLDLARKHGHSKVSGLFLLSSTLWQMGREDSGEIMKEWAEEARHSRDPVVLGKYHYHLGSGYGSGKAGETRDRPAHLRLALDLLREVGDRRGEASCLRNLAMEASLAGREDEAIRLNTQAMAIFESLGLRSLIALCANGFGESYRRLGRTADAEREYQRALTLWRALGDAEQVYPLLNLGLLAGASRRWPVSLARLSEARQLVEKQGRRHLVAVSGALMLVPLAGLRDGAAYDQRLDDADALVRHNFTDHDVAHALDFAASLCTEAGWTDRARKTAVYADHLWNGLGGRPV